MGDADPVLGADFLEHAAHCGRGRSRLQQDDCGFGEMISWISLSRLGGLVAAVGGLIAAAGGLIASAGGLIAAAGATAGGVAPCVVTTTVTIA